MNPSLFKRLLLVHYDNFLTCSFYQFYDAFAIFQTDTHAIFMLFYKKRGCASEHLVFSDTARYNKEKIAGAGGGCALLL